jgi:hypothetical protein
MTGPSRRPRVVEVPPRRPPAELRAVRVVVEEDPEPDASYLDQDELADRREEYRRGNFHFIGVRAEAEVLIAGTMQTLTSSGLYGIESDTDKEELEAIAHEEWSALRAVLKAVGVPTVQLPLEVSRERIEWRV